jgi:hypothetical protein
VIASFNTINSRVINPRTPSRLFKSQRMGKQNKKKLIRLRKRSHRVKMLMDQKLRELIVAIRDPVEVFLEEDAKVPILQMMMLLRRRPHQRLKLPSSPIRFQRKREARREELTTRRRRMLVLMTKLSQMMRRTAQTKRKIWSEVMMKRKNLTLNTLNLTVEAVTIKGSLSIRDLLTEEVSEEEDPLTEEKEKKTLTTLMMKKATMKMLIEMSDPH